MKNGEVDAILALPPLGEHLRNYKVGHTILNTATDRPWSQYYCCLVAANRQFMEKNPIATKRALRAILRGLDLCAREPERAARYLVDNYYTNSYDYALATMKMLGYGVWRQYNPEETLRFYSLQLRTAGLIKSTPDQIMAKGTDWRFYNELKREMPMAFAPSSSRFGLDCAIGPAERA